MTLIKSHAFVVLTTAVLATAACAERHATEEAPAEPPAATAEKSVEEAATPPSASAVAVAENPVTAGDYVRIRASHNPAKPSDPVMVNIRSFKISKASFDPKDLEGASAELELDFASIDSGSSKRDAHLSSPDYLDVSRFALATVKIDGVKKIGKKYTAKATIAAHGTGKTFPVFFEVIETADSWVKVKASHKFQRTDFGIGKAQGDPTATEVEIEMVLTLKRT